jgi:hypothetical protein
MPNWVDCELTITGKQEELQRFKEFAKTKYTEKGKQEINVLDTEKFIPYPKEFKERDEQASRYYLLKNKKKLTTKEQKELIILSLKNNSDKDGFNDGGYDWCCINWGTKWGICHATMVEDKKKLFYGFETAWSPPLPVIMKMTELFPALRFNLKYWEGGSGFRGKVILKGENIVKQNFYDNYKGGRGG